VVAGGVFLLAALLVQAGQPPARADGSSTGPVVVPTGECVVCHGSPGVVETPDGVRDALYVTDAQIAASVHAELTCTDCHDELTATGHSPDDDPLSACAACHDKEAQAYAKGAHAQQSELGPSPDCATCHGAHDVQPADAPGAAERVSARCVACHRQMSDHQFGSNPMGLETHLGRLDVATCWDCHEAHEVLPASDPGSSVSQQNKLTTCRQCHTDATANFRAIEIHVADGPLPNEPKLRFAMVWMLAILIFTFAFFGWLTILGIRHEWRRRTRGATQ
jgi:Cytochrome c3